MALSGGTAASAGPASGTEPVSGAPASGGGGATQLPAEHVDGAPHAAPHFPQFAGSTSSETSHPVDALPSQSAWPLVQASPQVTPLHVATESGPLAQAVQEPPQEATLALLAQAPPHAWNPVSHENVHAPDLQLTSPFATLAHA